MGGYATVDINSIGLGKGVWMKLTQDVTIDLTTGNQTIQDQYINLKRGWNLVSNPQMFPYDASNIVISYNNKTYSAMAAVSANLIFKTPYAWDGQQFVSQDQIIQPFGAFFIGAIRPVTAIFPSHDSVIIPMYMASEPASGRSLEFQVQALLEGIPLGHVNLVANEKASVFSDEIVPPPSPLGDVSVYANKEGNRLLTMQQAYQDNLQWPVCVIAERAGNITLKIKDIMNTESKPYQLSVLDVARNRALPVNGGEVTVYQNAGTGQYVIKAINAMAILGSTVSVYPNPFSPANGSATIAYNAPILSTPVTAKLAIYTLHGRKVLEKTYLSQANPGTLSWDGKDDNGTLLPSDLYFFILDLSDNSASIKLKGKIVLWQ
jgi:hypothetical protein